MAAIAIPTGVLKQLDVDSITVVGRYREEFGDLEHLAESIKEKGILQPITVSPDMQLLAGERRLRAAKLAGLTRIPALIRKIDGEVDSREIELIENVFRKNFEWHEECALIQEIDRLYKEKDYSWSGRKTAELLGKGVASVSRSLQLARACEAIPELRDIKTADDALKTVKKMEEDAIIGELRSRQKEGANAPAGSIGALDQGVKRLLEIANANYRIGDTFKGLSELRSNGVVHIIECDPPYGIDLAAVKSSKGNLTSNVHDYNEIPTKEYPDFLKDLAEELYRVAAPNAWLIFWFGPTWQHQVLTTLRAAGWEVDEIPCIWTKKSGQTLQPEVYLARAYEPFFLARKGKPVLVKRGRLNIFNYDTVPGQAKYHPTQRPIALIQEILETLGLARQTVLCPFLGSGATLRAAYYVGMPAFGWDLSPDYKDRFMLAVENDARTLGEDDGEGEEEDGE